MILPTKSMLISVSITGIFFSLMLFQSANAQSGSSHPVEVRSITVSGMGELFVVPDMATVRFGIVTVDDDPERARLMNAESASESMNGIRKMGIEERKIRLDALRLEPNRVMDEATRRYVEKGFRAIRDISVRLVNLELLPELIAGVVQNGANHIQGISYGLNDRRKIELEALKLAMTDAKMRAGVMVDVIGARLGDVLRISEQGVVVPQPMVRLEKAAGLNEMSADSAPDAFASGEMKITANVTLVFAIERP